MRGYISAGRLWVKPQVAHFFVPSGWQNSDETRSVSRVDSVALKGTWLGTLTRFLNPIMRLLLASPLHWPLSKWFLLLSWTGSKTGRARSTPVSYVSDATGIMVTTGDRWPRYVIGNPTFRVRHRGRWSLATVSEVSDPGESKREHVRIFDEHNWFRLLAGIPKKDGHTDVDAVARAIAAGRKLIRIDLPPANP